MKKWLFGVVVGVVLGLWFGVNIGKDQPLFANPFSNKTIAERVSESAGHALSEGKRQLKEIVN